MGRLGRGGGGGGSNPVRDSPVFSQPKGVGLDAEIVVEGIAQHSGQCHLLDLSQLSCKDITT